MVNTSRMLYLKVRSQHKNVSFHVNQERISKRVHLISNISTHKLFFYTWYPVHLQIMLLRTLRGSFLWRMKMRGTLLGPST